MIAESGICLARDVSRDAVSGGFWTTASAMGAPLIGRLQAKAGLACGHWGCRHRRNRRVTLVVGNYDALCAGRNFRCGRKSNAILLGPIGSLSSGPREAQAAARSITKQEAQARFLELLEKQA